MISFILSIAILILGYIFYGALAEKIFIADPNSVTPAIKNGDGVDYVPMKPWRAFLIQFLNIAGLGPIFGAIMGIFFGPSSFLWIVLGTIFAGGVHDYFSGMISLRIGGKSLPDVVGHGLGEGSKAIMRVVSIALLVLLTTSFISGAATLLQNLLHLPTLNLNGEDWPLTWVAIVFLYFIVATLLPIDKIIGHLYPLFGGILLFMGIGIMFVMVGRHSSEMPEIFDGLRNMHSGDLPIFPMMFVSIACGAISGFHGTQSPLMARCLTNEKQGRAIFYGAMVCEGIFALIWAAAAGTFFADPENGVYGIEGLKAFAAANPGKNIAALVVDVICNTWLGRIGGALAIVGVIIAPITSGDTALRSARLIIADSMGLDQKNPARRLVVTMPLVMIMIILLFVNFDSIWRYFSWTNQVLATITLMSASVILFNRDRSTRTGMRFGYLITLIPAAFMVMVCVSYIMIAPEGLDFNSRGLNNVAYIIAAVITIDIILLFYSNRMHIFKK